jgi:hypothetical protein
MAEVSAGAVEIAWRSQRVTGHATSSTTLDLSTRRTPSPLITAFDLQRNVADDEAGSNVGAYTARRMLRCPTS